jgi:hypothetical protein
MIGLWENKNIGEKNSKWIVKNTGILTDESGFKKHLFNGVEMIFSVSMKLLYHKRGVRATPTPPKGGCTPRGETP